MWDLGFASIFSKKKKKKKSIFGLLLLLSTESFLSTLGIQRIILPPLTFIIGSIH